MSTTATLLIAPDSFKGSLDAGAVGEALARGVRARTRAWVPEVLPLADGGEGSLDALARTRSGAWRRSPARDPWGRVRPARYLILHEPLLGLPAPIVAVEWSAAAGHRADRTPAEALSADSAGVGELIRAGLSAGCRSVLVALGGSATTDGGAGLLRALGARLLDRSGTPLPPGGAALRRLADVDLEPLPGVPVAVLGDVTAPLLGERGARRFAAQKGADRDAREVLEAALSRWAERLDPGGDLSARPGAGAAGGAGFGLMAGLGARAWPGAATLADLCGLDAALARADRIWTGEGRLDRSSAEGKVVSEVLRRARAPVDLIGGDLGAGLEPLDAPPVDHIVTLVDPPGAPPPQRWHPLGLPCTRAEALRDPAVALERLAGALAGVIGLPSPRP